MVDDDLIQLALRTRALSLVVATTGSMSLGATSTGFSRSTGSFITDGFARGMEVTGTGFSAANNAAKVITKVTAGFLTVEGGCALQSATAGRALTVGLPSSRAWENEKFEPAPGQPYVEEQYVPGPRRQITLGPNGVIEVTPMYQLQICVPEDTGILGSGGYTKALLNHFPPRLAIALSNGDVLRVRADVAPFTGQRLPSRPGFSVRPVTIPLRLQTTNTL